MFKKLCLVLLLTLVLAFSSVSFAAEDGQTCTLKPSSKVLQIMPNRGLNPVLTQEAVTIEIGPEISQAQVDALNSMPINKDLDWNGANFGMVEIDFGQGPVPIMLMVRDESLENCQ